MTSDNQTLYATLNFRNKGDSDQSNWSERMSGQITLHSDHLEFQDFSFSRENVESAVLNTYGRGRLKSCSLAITTDDGEFIFQVQPSKFLETAIPFPVVKTQEDFVGVRKIQRIWKFYLIAAILLIILIVLAEIFK